MLVGVASSPSVRSGTQLPQSAAPVAPHAIGPPPLQIAVDVVCTGENEFNAGRLAKLVEAANKEDNSHLLSIPAGVLPSDVLMEHPIMQGGGGAGAGAAGARCVCNVPDSRRAP